ncbi:DUF6192 family protein [Streptomyces virginiae]|uniref:DUF6192 family protein n=1 Tax=Streptomyces virginiae TaxID=1961 RepID=UPI003EBE2B62
MRTARWTSSRWPAERRQASVSFTVHRLLASIEDEQERFAAVLNRHEKRWTPG